MSTKNNITVTTKSTTPTTQSSKYNSYYSYDGYYTNYYNPYPSLKKEHDFSAVLTDDFKNILKLEQTELKKFLYELLKEKGYKPQFRQGYVFAKGDIPIMLVSHMDTVHKKPVKEIYVSDYGNITSPQGIGGDDRCGIYMITQLLKYKPYVLFTEDEEVGGVGAKKFVEAYKADNSDIERLNHLKYMIELDRKGSNDMVFYDCDNRDFENYIGKFGWDEKYGTYSDISDVAPAIGVAAVNLSSGYYKAHTTDEIINIDDVATNLKRVSKMVRAVSREDVPAFEYVEYKYKGYSKYTSTSSTVATNTVKADTSTMPSVTTVKVNDNAKPTTDNKAVTNTDVKNADDRIGKISLDEKPKEVTEKTTTNPVVENFIKVCENNSTPLDNTTKSAARYMLEKIFNILTRKKKEVTGE